MSPFEAARKLLDADSVKMSLSAKADLVFQVRCGATCIKASALRISPSNTHGLASAWPWWSS